MSKINTKMTFGEESSFSFLGKISLLYSSLYQSRLGATGFNIPEADYLLSRSYLC